MMDNLWGGFDDIKVEMRVPRLVLEEQAKYLNEGLDGLIIGEVTRIM